MTVQRARAGRRAERRSSTARRWFSNCEVTAPSCDPVPGVVRSHRQLVDQHPPVGGLEQLDGQHPGHVELAGQAQRDPCASAGQVGVEVGGRRDDLVADAVALGRRDDRVGGGLAARRARRPAPTARGGSRPAPRRAAATPDAAAPRRTPRRIAGEVVDEPHALAVVAPARRLEHARHAEGLDLGGRGDHGVARARAPRARSGAPASRPCPGRARARRARAARRRRRPPARRRCSVGTCSWSKVTTAAPSVTARRASRSVWSPTSWSGITWAADTPGASASSRSGMPSAAAGSAIIRASWPPPMTATTGASSGTGSRAYADRRPARTAASDRRRRPAASLEAQALAAEGA